tara:strand:+ start:6555 stop:7604 length:1050 start_codon:yes stop_codon:yes gene_type:complete
MSHFTVLVVLPKEGLQKYENETIHEGDDEWRNAYNHQWFHPELEGAMLPYYEQHEADSEYMERDTDLCETATEVYSAYLNKSWDTLAELHNNRRELIEKWERGASIHDTSVEGGFRKATESEIATKLEPIDKLYELMASEKFDIKNEEHQEPFKEIYCDSSEIVIDNDTIYNVWYSNPYAKWDWWVVGGRWRSMGDNGLFTDLSVFLETKQIPYWKEELGFKLYDIERELDIDRETINPIEYTEKIEEYIKNNKIPRFYDRDTKEVTEYYTTEDLLTKVTRKKESTWAMLFPEEGWIEAGEMGWFGMSSLDSLDLNETEQAKGDQFALTDNLIEKYKDTHIGLVVDCHI